MKRFIILAFVLLMFLASSCSSENQEKILIKHDEEKLETDSEDEQEQESMKKEADASKKISDQKKEESQAKEDAEQDENKKNKTKTEDDSDKNKKDAKTTVNREIEKDKSANDSQVANKPLQNDSATTNTQPVQMQAPSQTQVTTENEVANPPIELFNTPSDQPGVDQEAADAYEEFNANRDDNKVLDPSEFSDIVMRAYIDGNDLYLDVTNNSQYCISSASSFVIQKNQGGTWVDVPNSAIFQSMSKVVDPGLTVDLGMKQIFNCVSFEPGVQYRVVQKMKVSSQGFLNLLAPIEGLN